MCTSIYFVRDEQMGLVKIGVSADVSRRFKQLKRGSNNTLSLLGTLPGLGFRHEKLFHSFLTEKGKHERLEWFKLDFETTMFLFRFGGFYTRCRLGDNEYWRECWGEIAPSLFLTQLDRSWNEGTSWVSDWA